MADGEQRLYWSSRVVRRKRLSVIERIVAVWLREWDDLRHSRIIVATLLVPSVIFALLPL